MGFKETTERAGPFILINFAFFLLPRHKSPGITGARPRPNSDPVINFMFVGESVGKDKQKRKADTNIRTSRGVIGYCPAKLEF